VHSVFIVDTWTISSFMFICVKEANNKKGFTLIPKNLEEMLRDPSKYRLLQCYSLSLKHGLMGFFPAIVRKTKEMVLATERQVILDVWKRLSPRESELNQQVFYVNRKLGVAFEYPSKEWGRERIKPIKILSRAEFEKLKTDPDAFMWAPGLIGNDMSPREFAESILAAVRREKECA
jgi:hypothetical protein